MFRCIVGGVITCFKGVLAAFHKAGLVSACVFSLPPLLGGHHWGLWGP